jgi:hypothetical protein
MEAELHHILGLPTARRLTATTIFSRPRHERSAFLSPRFESNVHAAR